MNNFITAMLAASFGIVIVMVVGIIGAIPMYFLWNWLMPDLFALKSITFVQAWGMVFMCGILFKSSNTTSK